MSSVYAANEYLLTTTPRKREPATQINCSQLTVIHSGVLATNADNKPNTGHDLAYGDQSYHIAHSNHNHATSHWLSDNHKLY